MNNYDELERIGLLDDITALGLSNSRIRHDDLRGKRYGAKYSKVDRTITMPEPMHPNYPGSYHDLLGHEAKHSGFDTLGRALNLAPGSPTPLKVHPMLEWLMPKTAPNPYPDIREIVGLLPNFEPNPHRETFFDNPRWARQPHKDNLFNLDPRKKQWGHDMIYDTNKINRRHSPNVERRKKDYQNILDVLGGWG